MNLDYLSENALRSYPFKDGANMGLVIGVGTVINVPSSVVLDLQFNACQLDELTPPYTFQLSSITTGFPIVLNFTGAVSFSFSLSGDGVQTFYSTVGNNSAKITVDMTELNALLGENNIDDTGLTYTFTDPPVTCVRCIRFQPQMVHSVNLVNTNGGNLNDVAFDHTYTTAFAVNAGSNLALSGGVTLDVQTGAGTGLYDGCPTTVDKLLSINNQTADNNGNLIFNTDGCIRVSPSDYGLMLGNSCQPSCTSPDILNFAYYVNRVWNRATELHVLAAGAAQDYDTMIHLYENQEMGKYDERAPYILAESSMQSNRVNNFHNVTFGVYSPSKVDVPISLTVSYTTGSALSQYSIADGRSYITQDNINKPIAFADLSGSRKLGMNSALFGGFVVQQPVAALPNTGEEDYNVRFALTSSVYKAGYILAVNPKAPNFDLRYATETTSSHKILRMEVRFTSGPGVGAVATTLQFLNFGGFFQVDLSKLTLNYATPLDLGNAMGFASQVIDYSKPNQYNITLSCPIGQVVNQSAQVRLASGAGSAMKNITIQI